MKSVRFTYSVWINEHLLRITFKEKQKWPVLLWLVNWSAYHHQNDFFLIQIYEKKKEKNIRIRVTKSA